MTTFDEREQAYEAKFARDQELRFKAKARRDKYLGNWAAEQLGLKGPAADDYAMEVLRADFKAAGDAGIIAKLLGDFKGKGIVLDEAALKRKMIELMSQAVAEVEAGR